MPASKSSVVCGVPEGRLGAGPAAGEYSFIFFIPPILMASVLFDRGITVRRAVEIEQRSHVVLHPSLQVRLQVRLRHEIACVRGDVLQRADDRVVLRRDVE